MIDAIKQCKTSAFSDFYDQYAPAFYGVIKRTLYEPQACAQTLDNAFCTIWTSISKYDSSKERFFTWSLTIVRQKASMKKIDMVLHEIFACQQIAPIPAEQKNTTTSI